MTLAARIRANSGYDISTTDGLREAVWDVIHDEVDDTFTMKWLANRLPYGVRVRKLMQEFVQAGVVQRIGYGIYKRLSIVHES